MLLLFKMKLLKKIIILIMVIVILAVSLFESEGHYPFWMKNTLIPLDMIWIDEDKEIVFIYENALPCEEDPCTVISPSGNAKYVFEINGGLTSKKGIVVGQKLEFIKN